jgi:hypothetical protein
VKGVFRPGSKKITSSKDRITIVRESSRDIRDGRPNRNVEIPFVSRGRNIGSIEGFGVPIGLEIAEREYGLDKGRVEFRIAELLLDISGSGADLIEPGKVVEKEGEGIEAKPPYWRTHPG